MTDYNNAFSPITNGHHPQMDQRYDIAYNNGSDYCETIPSVLVVDSQYRDDIVSTTASDYNVTLINKYPDVTSIELVYADIPNSNYNIHAYNNLLHIMPVGPAAVLTNISGPIREGITTEVAVLPSPALDAANGRPYNTGLDDGSVTISRDGTGAITGISITDGGHNFIVGDSVSITDGDGGTITATVSETVTQTVTLTPGLYTHDTLKEHLRTQLAADLTVLDGDGGTDLSTYANWIADITDEDSGDNLALGLIQMQNTMFHFTIKAASSVGTYMTNTVTRILGFKPENKTSNLDGLFQVLSDYPVELEMDHYISMFIEGMERCDGNHTHVQDAFCIVPLDAQQQNFGLFKDSNNIDNDNFRYYFHQPKKLSKLHISFRDWNGNPYDFNGLNHVLIFRIETATHKKKFNIGKSCAKGGKKHHRHQKHKHKFGGCG